MRCSSCSNPAAPQRTVCNTCRHKSWLSKGDNRLRKMWHHLKKSAKNRSKPFGLTFEHLQQVVAGCSLDDFGRAADSLTIHRIRNAEGYIDGNIMVKPKGANTREYWEEVRELNKTTKYKLNDGTPVPF